ncbi:MAG: DNA gyrase inhibitor YacG [Deltaproteobacteria bacterium]|nr:DNA gyrase inhibitor YacG [Deltaproteobacteria bacterium]
MKVRCPWCRAETAWEGNPWRPFCSERCRLLDLGAWASGRYAIPGPPVEEEQCAEAQTELGMPASRREPPGAVPTQGPGPLRGSERPPRRKPGAGETEDTP